MAKKPENPPAFPNTGNSNWGMDPDYGMTLRDWFAGQALAGGLASGAPIDGANPDHREELAVTVYAIADAMLATREENS